MSYSVSLHTCMFVGLAYLCKVCIYTRPHRQTFMKGDSRKCARKARNVTLTFMISDVHMQTGAFPTINVFHPTGSAHIQN